MNTADILDKAADLIEQRGHAKRHHVTARGRLCAAGAMFVAVGIEPMVGTNDVEKWPTHNHAAGQLVRIAYDWFGAWLNRSGTDHVVDAVTWNDRRARTKEEVVSTLRAAAQVSDA